jgi:riboflavin biosynthesis pyrimidine reductase
VHVVWYTAMSMDGRIASADHDLGFLDTVDTGGVGEQEFPALIASLDAVLVGASTLRWLVGGGHGWPHDDIPTWLISHDESLAESVRPTRAPLRRVEGDIGVALDEIEAAGHNRVWLAGGGDLAAQVLALDRLDEVIVTIAPTVVGRGPALFDGAIADHRMFEVAEARPIGNAVRVRWLRSPES